MFFLVDNSKEVKKETLDAVKAFIVHLAKVYKVSQRSSRFGIFSYGSSSTKVLPVSSGISVKAVEDGLGRIDKSEEPRNAAKALESVRDVVVNAKDGTRYDAGKVVILFMAGPNVASSLERLKSEMKSLNGAGVKIVVIGIGSGRNAGQINSADAQFVKVPSREHLPEATASVSESVSGTQELSTKLDLAFIIGASGSNAGKDFETAKRFIKELVQRLDVSSDGTRVGLVSYGARAEVVARFDGTVDKERALLEIARIRRPAPGEALSLAIEMTSAFIFDKLYGARKDNPQTAVILANKDPDLKSRLAAERLMKKGVRLMALMVGTQGSTESMKDISSSENDILRVENDRSISSAAKDVLSKLLPGN